VFVSHTHMDHFAGFDHLLRVCLGRDTGVRMYGPPDFIEQVGHKLHAYTWNLVENNASEFTVVAHELHSPQPMQRAMFRSRDRFRLETLPPIEMPSDEVLNDEQFRIRARPFDHHGLPSYAFAFEERTHLNVWKSRLDELGLPTGPWLAELKRCVRAGEPDTSIIEVRWRTRDGSRSETFRLGELKHRVLELVAGQRVCYVTDVAGHDDNQDALRAFLREADVAYIEAVFLDEDCGHAARKAHLTASQAGRIAREAGVKLAVPFHFSSRYFPDEQRLREEFERSYRG
jgi:ribonuclease Z